MPYTGSCRLKLRIGIISSPWLQPRHCSVRDRHSNFSHWNRIFCYTLGCNLGALILDAIRFLLLTRPLEEYRHETDKVPTYQLPYIQRFFWLVSISQRGIGWSFGANHSIPSVQPHHLTRKAFVTSRLRRVFVYYLIFEAIQLYIGCNPVFSSEAPLLSQGYFLVAVIAVGTTLHEPRSWPAPFGKWKDAYTIRRFWGRTWHQFTRHTFTPSVLTGTNVALGIVHLHRILRPV
ncbi:hypothetical protein EDC04DRAFT_633642 [Pisolithus marmoratus]|nr:hypothetical protein EDC04DRAFT_633642 [Pisolithus marmoratus]